ncbi:MAG: hypothetical protein GTO30_08660 [Acidobacteria bacterium]|nr:hypothetical protein [Acidobacteriota bacterium]NIM61708.1 hypothetical protein [Acidobacteriota bacterium]NIO58190.1 hypothetical protein [Acidobacteriota bacterium]NIQ83755.1 hypothetical protein [Acidobacteriota bacterium]NIT09918.1 hypothetical protein [Acidobacteriota bacterium]
MKNLWLATLTLLLCVAPSNAQEACPEGNLLAGKQPIEWLDAYHVARITDGVVSPDGNVWNSTTNSPLTPHGYVVYDLGARVTIASVFLQVEGASGYRISVSDDLEEWTVVSELPPAGAPGMRDRRASSLATPARYLRIASGDAAALYAIGEAAVWCRPPAEWPPRFETREGVVQDAEWSAARKRRLGYAKLACLVVAAGLLYGARKYERRRRWLYGAVALLGALAWTNFGSFHGNGVIHYHENYHYYLGAKYFHENGYTGLYACTLWAEKELGLEAAARNRYVTDLETNRMVAGGELLSAEPACRTRFDEARWSAFREDVRFFRNNLYPGSWQRIFRDHGYNPTPVWTMFGRLASAGGPAASVVPRVVWIDVALWIGIGALMLWGFGWEALALTFLTLGSGLPWHFDWTGGAFGRTPWLFCLVAGLCLTYKRKHVAGGFLLAAAALLRVFPAVFFGVLLIGLVVALVRRRPDPEARRVFAGAGAAILALGGLSVLGAGLDGWTGFADNLAKHSGTPTGNLMGLPTIVGFDPASSQSEVLGSDIESLQRWRNSRTETLRARAPINIALGCLAVAGMVWTVLRRRWPVWEWVVAATVLAVTLGQLSCYYYVFLILLVPWVRHHPVRIAVLLVGLASSQAIGLAGLETDVRFLWLSVLFVALPVLLWIVRLREPEA